MKKIFILIIALPLLGVSQVKHPPKTQRKTTSMQSPQSTEGFTITGEVKGFAEGTPVSFINDQTGVPEQQTTIKNEKFIISGKMDQPGFRVLFFGDQQNAVPLFLDNSRIQFTGSKNALNDAVITGSPSHTQFLEYIIAIKPYEKVFLPDAEYDSAAAIQIANISENFVKKYPSSYVSPLAVIRLYQATQNGVKSEELYNLFSKEIKVSPLGAYANQQIQESKINPIGSRVADFSQADTTGNLVKISSFRGKYVLVDFWASWCRPCRMENPNVVAAFNKFKDKNFTILGVSLDQAKDAWVNAINMDNLTWSHVSDLKGWGNSVAAQFQVRGIPQNFLLDPEGRIIAKNLRGAVLEKKLEAVLK